MKKMCSYHTQLAVVPRKHQAVVEARRTVLPAVEARRTVLPAVEARRTVLPAVEARRMVLPAVVARRTVHHRTVAQILRKVLTVGHHRSGEELRSTRHRSRSRSRFRFRTYPFPPWAVCLQAEVHRRENRKKAERHRIRCLCRHS
jgi:hypothetical protein